MEDIKNIVGEVYENYTIVDIAEIVKYKNYKQRMVIVKCDCGDIKKVVYRGLKKFAYSCKMCYLQKFIKRDFKNWKVVLPNQIIKTSSDKILVKCVCGKQKYLTVSQLKFGIPQSCGCILYKKEICETPCNNSCEEWKDHFKNNKIMVSSKGNYYSKTNKMYIIKNKTLKNEDSLYRTFFGNYDEKNFRVIKKEDCKQDISNLYLIPLNEKNQTWLSLMMSKVKNKTSKKDLIDIYERQKGLSYFLKIPLDIYRTNILTSISPDRIDNSKGYTKDNINFVTIFENIGRGDKTKEDFEIFCGNLKYTH